MLFILFLAFGLATSDTIVKRCKLSDETCIKNSAQEFIPYFTSGFPEYDMPTLDPYIIEELDFSYLGLKFLLTDVSISGLKNCQVSELTIKNSTLETVIVCDIYVTAQYEINGKLLFVPIQSKGQSQVLIPKMQVTGKSLLSEYTGKDGKKHWALKSLKRHFKLLEKTSINMDGLFGENTILSNMLHELLNYYSNNMVYDMLPQVINKLVGIVEKSVNTFFSVFTLDNLIL